MYLLYVYTTVSQMIGTSLYMPELPSNVNLLIFLDSKDMVKQYK